MEVAAVMDRWQLQCKEPPVSPGGWVSESAPGLMLLGSVFSFLRRMWCTWILRHFWTFYGAVLFGSFKPQCLDRSRFFLVALEFYSSPIFLLMLRCPFVLPSTTWVLFHCSDTCCFEGKCNLFTCHPPGPVSPLTSGCCLLTVVASLRALYSLALYFCTLVTNVQLLLAFIILSSKDDLSWWRKRWLLCLNQTIHHLIRATCFLISGKYILSIIPWFRDVGCYATWLAGHCMLCKRHRRIAEWLGWRGTLKPSQSPPLP